MAELVSVANVNEIPEGSSKVVEFAGEEVVIFNVDGKFYAISDTCPHAGGPLSEGFIDDNKVTCPWHGWTFSLDLDDQTPPSDMICKYRVHIDGDDIQLEAQA